MGLFSVMFGKKSPEEEVTPEAKPRFRELLGKRIHHLRKNVFQVNERKFAYRFDLTATDIEDIENGTKEAPKAMIETLINDYRVREEYLDGENYHSQMFSPISVTSDNVCRLVKTGFRVEFVIPRPGCPDHSDFSTVPVLKKEDPHLPYFYMGPQTSFKSTHGGYNIVRDVFWGCHKAGKTCPDVFFSEISAWEKLVKYSYYSPSGGPTGNKCWDLSDVVDRMWRMEIEREETGRFVKRPEKITQ